MQERLNKYIAGCGICSRREADKKISSGSVKINDRIAILGDMIDPEKDKIYVEENLINCSQKNVYIAVYKPKGVISSSKDEKGRETIVDLVNFPTRLFPVGRLDKESEGLMILTNDGELTNILTHPKNEHDKEYEIKVKILDPELKPKDIEQSFTSGMVIEGQLMKADKVVIKKSPDTKYIILNTILHTGYNRQLRKMCDKINLDIKKLTRIRVAKLELSRLNLKPGQFKRVAKNDIL